MALNKYTTKAITAIFIQFTGGLNSAGGSLNLSNQESSKLQNIDFDRFGSILKRNGYSAVNTAEINSGGRVTCLHNFELADGTRYFVTIVGNKVYYWSSTAITGAPTEITGAVTVTAGNLFSHATFRDTALFTDGVDPVFKWTGTGNCSALTVPTGMTAAKYVAIFQNYTFLANVTVSGTNYRSRIHYSNINTIETWTDSDFTDVSRDDGQTITGLKALGDRLVIFKDRSIWIAQFTADADAPFNFTNTNSSVGCVAPFSIQEAYNGLIFLSWDGIYFFDGFNSYKISDQLNQTFSVDLNPSKFVNAVSMYQHSKNRYWLGITGVSSNTNNTVITWTKAQTTVDTNAFSVYKGINASSMEIVFPDGITETPYFGDYSGFDYKADTGLNDNPLNVATAIDGYYYTNWISFDDICDQKGTLSVYIYFATNNATLTFVYAYDFNDGDVNTQTFSTSAGGALWDSAIWDQDVWVGGSGAQIRRDITGRGRVVRFGIKNSTLSETFRIDGLGTLTYLETNV